jgi:hypothetical protein
MHTRPKVKLSDVYRRKHQQCGDPEMPANFQQLAESVRDRLALILGPMGWEVELRAVPAPFGNGRDLAAELRCSLTVRDPRHPLRGQALGYTAAVLDERDPKLRDRGYVEHLHLRIAQDVFRAAVGLLDVGDARPDAVVKAGGA